MTVEDAAWQTKTGGYVKGEGLTKVENVPYDPQDPVKKHGTRGMPGHYTKVLVKFSL